jgi:hypothetical protein
MKKYHTFSIVISDHEWRSPSDLSEIIRGYLSTMSAVANSKKNFSYSKLTEYDKGGRRIIVMLTEWDAEPE